jgi:hypothetical protein
MRHFNIKEHHFGFVALDGFDAHLRGVAQGFYFYSGALGFQQPFHHFKAIGFVVYQNAAYEHHAHSNCELKGFVFSLK